MAMKRARASSCKWADLPPDLVALISRKASSSPGDDARFSAVCRSWKEACAAAAPHGWDVPSPARFLPFRGQLRPLLPLVLGGQSLPLDLPAPQCFCIGSSRGLLLCYDPSYRLFLFDPRTATSAHVPQPNFPETLELFPSDSGRVTYYCARYGLVTDDFRSTYIVCPESLSLSSTDSSDCVAICFYGFMSNFIYLRSGEDRWRLLPCQEPVVQPAHVYYRGRFYFVDGISFKLFVCDIGQSTAAVRHIPITRSSMESINKGVAAGRVVRTFLVECCGDLLLVVWSASETGSCSDYVRSSAFNIFKLHTGDGQATWAEQGDLGCHALFLGYNESFSLSAHDYGGFEPNCVYLIRSCPTTRNRCDRFVYRIDSRTIDMIHDDQVESGDDSCHFLWIAPRLQEEAC